MVVKVDHTTVFKEENVSPLTYNDMEVHYKGNGDYGYADAKIRKLLIRSFDF